MEKTKMIVKGNEIYDRDTDRPLNEDALRKQTFKKERDMI
jgi:hypothetical protein